MTLQHWIERCDPEPPAALAQRMREAVSAMPVGPARSVPEAAVDAALLMLDSLLRDADSTRGGALRLLAADALMTYAFEAAADTPHRIDALGAEAMRRIAAVTADLSQ
jgi:hypothetical protein